MIMYIAMALKFYNLYHKLSKPVKNHSTFGFQQVQHRGRGMEQICDPYFLG